MKGPRDRRRTEGESNGERRGRANGGNRESEIDGERRGKATENGGGERRRTEGESDGERRGDRTEVTRRRFRLEGEDRD